MSTATKRDEVKVGQIWRDRDKRMLGGDRQVRVVNCDGGFVFYTSRYFAERTPLRSRYERFQRAFKLVR
jgi:hypothetical protein